MAALIGWVDPDTVAEYWEDAALATDAVVEDLLEVAYETCSAYAPAIPASEDGSPGVVPARYRKAQILQAKSIWAMQRQGPGETFNGDGFSVAVYPLDARIRALLRPRRAFGGLR